MLSIADSLISLHSFQGRGVPSHPALHLSLHNHLTANHFLSVVWLTVADKGTASCNGPGVDTLHHYTHVPV